MKKKFLLLLLFPLLFASCFEDLDDNPQQASTLEIQDFIYRGLNFFYLYKADTPELANDAFENESEKNSFLSSFDSPESLFDYLISDRDRFSVLVEDYIALENSLGGTTQNNGMEYGLVRYSEGSSQVFGYVRYVLPNTDAEAKGLERGMIFNRIDGTQLTVTNFSELLAPQTYTIGLAEFEGDNINPIQQEIELTKEEYTENPIFISKTIDHQGIKVGYLMYNAFTSNFDEELNAAFAQFQTENIQELVVDLRYNGGGSVRTATYLAGMITGQFTGEIFYTEQWNADRQEQYAENGVFLESFVNGGPALNSLNLNNVYIIGTENTASASELIINGLSPYINVIHVGDFTRGKYQASFTLYDAPAPNFSRNLANPAHTYAMLPLVFKTANANGNTDYDEGLMPDIELREDFANLGMLGNPDERLLNAALNDISPTHAPILQPSKKCEEVSERKALYPLYQLMIAEK